jgi:tRNA (guanine37-N1)-methyltransferase
VCGRYEGVDERTLFFVDEGISIGDFILTGGEMPAMVIADAVSRLVPGVVGESASVSEDTFSNSLLKYPQYTRPKKFRHHEVPDILVSGDHKEIMKWRRIESLKKTFSKRPDLLDHAVLNDEDKENLKRIEMELKNECH